ncbi:MAG: AMP-binding protein, partial [Owenweeksia sp.]
MTWNSNIVNRFLTAADKYPGRNAITETTGNITYGKLKERVSEYAGYLKASGIQTGDRVLVFLPISIELYVTVLAIFQIGAVAVFLDPWSGWKRLKASAELADCKALVAGWKIRLLMRFMPVFRSIHLKLGPGRKESPLRDTCFCEPDDQALITFTTGSSGTPKAANRTHGFLQSQLNALEDEVPFWEDDVLLTNLPVFVLVGLARGTTVVLPDYNARKPTNMKPEKVQKQITEASVRTLITSPDFAGRLAEEGPYTVQRLFTGGAPVFPPLAQKLGKAFKEAKIIVAYGSTEAEPISSLTAEELLEEQLISGGLPAGKPYSKCEVKIIGWRDETLQPDREAFQDLCLPEG